ncbi:uncharacterized protein LOC124898436 [Capsicum annuum]|uniref:uncharacterized protein LOC124898436 n=1 Tax=Capsicum annuum TaxID=4072 RepID=UPI001FB07C54|nr:uncharacterized protein LOC124898436 [Capsicum annuum]
MIMIWHLGKWTEDNKYNDYETEGIVLNEYASHRDLVELIGSQLMIDLRVKTVKIKYSVEGVNKLIEIHNDMGVKVYIQLKKLNNVLAKYPLCVNFSDDEISKDVSAGNLIGNELMSANDFELDTVTSIDPLQMMIPDYGKPITLQNFIFDTNKKEIVVGQRYKDKATLQAVMHNYSINHRFATKVPRSNASSYWLKCKSKECKYFLKSSSLNDSKDFAVRTFVSEHTCSLKENIYKDSHATSKLIAGIIKSKIANLRRKYTPTDIRDDIKEDIGLDVTYMVAWRAKEKAVDSIMGKSARSFQKLPAYLYTMEKTYPGSHIQMKKMPEN